MKVTVKQPFSVTHDGVSYGPGETADVPSSLADIWESSGWLDRAKPTPRKEASA